MKWIQKTALLFLIMSILFGCSDRRYGHMLRRTSSKRVASSHVNQHHQTKVHLQDTSICNITETPFGSGLSNLELEEVVPTTMASLKLDMPTSNLFISNNQKSIPVLKSSFAKKNLFAKAMKVNSTSNPQQTSKPQMDEAGAIFLVLGVPSIIAFILVAFLGVGIIAGLLIWALLLLVFLMVLVSSS